MPQQGEHTWDLIYNYHRCPECGKIIESRVDYHYQLGKYQKEVVCDRCSHTFVVVKERKSTVFTGDSQLETEWGDPNGN